MKVLITDLKTLATVPPLDLVSYFRATGWREVDPQGPLTGWEFDAGERGILDASVPQRQGWRDYARQVQLAIERLALVERRSALAILRDVTQVSADVIRLKADGSAVDGTVRLEDGATLVASLSKMLLSAACSAIEPRRAYHTRKPGRALDFCSGVRLGQTERGSYVVSAISRVPPVLQSHQLSLNFPQPPGGIVVSDYSPEPFERRVVRTLADALGELEHAASRGAASGRLDAFEEAVPRGVSADLCESIAALKSCAATAFEVRVGWAPVRPPAKWEPVVASFGEDAVAVIEEAGRMLREKEPVPGFGVRGLVLKVAREPTEQDKTGEVEVLAVVDGVQRPIRLQLTGESWQRAHEALSSRRVVWCEGELIRTAKPFRLEHPGELVFAADEPD